LSGVTMRQRFCWPQPQNGNVLRRPWARRAIAAVEVAIVVPVLLVLMLGLFELSRAMMVKQILCDAARKGCRTGIVHQYANQDITNDATNILRDNGFDTTKFNPPSLGSITITVTAPDGSTLADALDAAAGSTVSVKVALPASSIDWVSSFFLTTSMIESDTVVMMKQ
jgi:Flp pilus assembly protein TadG